MGKWSRNASRPVSWGNENVVWANNVHGRAAPANSGPAAARLQLASFGSFAAVTPFAGRKRRALRRMSAAREAVTAISSREDGEGIVLNGLVPPSEGAKGADS